MEESAEESMGEKEVRGARSGREVVVMMVRRRGRQVPLKQMIINVTTVGS